MLLAGCIIPGKVVHLLGPVTKIRSGSPQLLKESGLSAGTDHLEMGDSHHKAHLHLSVEAEISIRRERGTEQGDQGRSLQSSVRADEHSPF